MMNNKTRKKVENNKTAWPCLRAWEKWLFSCEVTVLFVIFYLWLRYLAPFVGHAIIMALQDKFLMSSEKFISMGLFVSAAMGSAGLALLLFVISAICKHYKRKNQRRQKQPEVEIHG